MNNQARKNYTPTIYHFIKPFIGLAVLIIVGTTFYVKFEGWSLIDALFMSAETLTTVGYGVMHPLSVVGKIFTIFYIIFGVILFLYLAAELAEHIFMAKFDRTFKRRAMENKIKKLKNHYIVCGYGRTGIEIAGQLKSNKADFVVIDKDINIENTIGEEGHLYLIGDATDDYMLEKAGIENAKGIFCALSDDVDNLYLTVSSNSMKTDLKIVARCVKASNEPKFIKAGATNTILPYEICARRMVASVVKPHVVDFLDVVMHTKGQDLELKLEQFLLKKDSEIEGETILTSKIREKTGIIIVALKREGKFITNPTPTTALNSDDYIIALGTTQQLAEFEKLV